MTRKKDILYFIKKLLTISIPIILSNLFVNLASLIDTMMVGNLEGVSEVSLSGVYIATQIIFVINLAVFGSVEGAGVFFSQFLGKKDYAHLSNTFAFKLIFSFIVTFISTLIVYAFGRQLVSIFTYDDVTIEIAVQYLRIVGISIIPFGVTVSCTTSLRESHSAIAPMIVTLCGIFVNLFVNYILIFGNWGAPKLEAAGAAIGTVCNRYFEFIVIIIVLIVKKKDFTKNLLASFKIDSELLKNLILKSIPLLLNELFWSLGQTCLVYVFTQKNEIATTVLPIVSTIFNLIMVVSLGMGNGISIIIGNILGSNDSKEAQNKAYVSLIFSLLLSILLGTILFISSPGIVSLYSGISLETKEIATYLLKFDAIYLVIATIDTIMFFLLRAGGRTLVVFLFDSAFGWIVSIPIAFLFYRFLPNISFEQLFIYVYLFDLLKTVIGMILIFSKVWNRNIINRYQNEVK